MKFEDFPGLPSGNEYGTLLNWSLLDGDDFTVAFYAKGNPFGPVENDEFTWIVEAKNGDTVYKSQHVPMYRPVFGLDAAEWQDFKMKVLPIVDKYIEESKQ